MPTKTVEGVIAQIVQSYGVREFSTIDVIGEVRRRHRAIWSALIAEYGSGGRGSGRRYTAFSRIATALDAKARAGTLDKCDYRRAPDRYGSPVVRYWKATDAEWSAGHRALPPERREYLREVAVRNRKNVLELKKLYGGFCQLSGRRAFGGEAGDITEAHHIKWLTHDGPDTKANMVILSPDAHAAIHATNALFDWADLSFVVAGRRVPLALNEHLRRKPI